MVWKSKFAIRIAEQNTIKDGKEQGFYDAMTSVDKAAQPFDDSNPIQFKKKVWSELNQGGRRKWLERQKRRMTPAEQEIQRSLSKPVEVQFNQRPLKEVIDTLAAEHLDLYGYPRPTAPRLAELARRATLFAEMFSNASHTLESIPSLMLSMPVEPHGVHHASLAPSAELVTLAEALQAAGFATASFCTNDKYHATFLGSLPAA